MAHIEIHTIRGRKYRYEVTNYRDGSKVKHKWKYLGAVEPVNKRSNPNAGRKPKLKVRELSSEEREIIKQNLKSSKSFVKDRARLINLSADGKTVKEICKELGFYRPKIEKIINQFNEKGLKIFERGKSPGRPRRITKEERAQIIQWLNTHPEKLELHFNNWSKNKLSQFAKQNNIKVSPSQIGRIIKHDEIKYKTKRSKMYSDDKFFLKNI